MTLMDASADDAGHDRPGDQDKHHHQAGDDRHPPKVGGDVGDAVERDGRVVGLQRLDHRGRGAEPGAPLSRALRRRGDRGPGRGDAADPPALRLGVRGLGGGVLERRLGARTELSGGWRGLGPGSRGDGGTGRGGGRDLKARSILCGPLGGAALLLLPRLLGHVPASKPSRREASPNPAARAPATLGAMTASAVPRPRTWFIDRYSALFISLSAALWASDAYFRPALVNQWKLSASQIVLAETLLISLCFIPVAARVARELRTASWRTWLALAVIAAGPQALATVLFTRSIGYAYPPVVAASQTAGVLSEIYLLYLLQPVFGATMAWAVLGERRRPVFWPMAGLALAGAAIIVFASNAAAPQAQLVAALFVLGAVILWAAGTVLGRYALSGVSFTTTSATRFTLALPVLLVLMLTDRGAAGFSQYSAGQLPSFLGIALVPGLIAMVLYYRALSSTPASISSFAELGYPAALFLVFSLPAPVGYGAPLQPLEILGAVILVVSVTSLNVLKGREVVSARRPTELHLASESSAR